MSNIFDLECQPRTDVGKGASRRLRRNNLVPGILYGANEAPMMMTIPHHKLAKALSQEAFYSHILTVSCEGKKEKAVLKALQRHPSEKRILHIDLLRVKANEPIIMNVPIHFKGADIAPGVKLEGGSIFHLLNDVEIKCLPKDLPSFIEIDISEMNLDESLHLSDLKLPKGVEIPALLAQGPEQDQSIVSCHIQRVQIIEEEPTEAEEVEGEGEGEGEGAESAEAGKEDKGKGKGKGKGEGADKGSDKS